MRPVLLDLVLLGALSGATALLAPSLPRCRRTLVPRRGTLLRCSSSAPPNVVTDVEELLRQRRAWALLFNYRTDNEGIYSQQREDGDEYIMTWEVEEDAMRYAEMLFAQDFPEGTAVEMETETLLEFCREAGHTLCLVPSTTVVLPPETNVEQFEWSPGVSAEATQGLQEMTEEEMDLRRAQLEAMLRGGGGDADASTADDP